MQCENALGMLPAYQARGLDTDDVVALLRHLEECESCASALSLERHLDSMVTEAVTSAAPAADALQLRVQRQIAATPRRRVVAWSWLATAAMFLVATGLGLNLWLNGDARKMHLLCADAADDHRTEVTEHAALRWRTTLPEIQALARQYVGAVEPPATIESQHLALHRARICRLNGMRFLHMVYRDTNGNREVSVFLATADDDRSRWEGVPAHHATAVHEETSGGVDVSAVHSADLMVVVAADQANGTATKGIAAELAGKM